MKCIVCGKQARALEAGWRKVVYGIVEYHACSDHFPPKGAAPELLEDAYDIVLAAIVKHYKTVVKTAEGW